MSNGIRSLPRYQGGAHVPQNYGMPSDTLSTVARQPFLNRPELTIPNEMMAWVEGRSPMAAWATGDDSRRAAYLKAFMALQGAEGRDSPVNIYTSFNSRQPADFSEWRQNFEDPVSNEYVTRLWHTIKQVRDGELEGRASGGIIGLLRSLPRYQQGGVTLR